MMSTAFWKNFGSGGKRWLEYMHHAYILLAVVGYVVAIFTASDSTKTTVLLVVLCLYVFFVFVIFCYFTYTLGYKARYAEAMAYLHHAEHHARDAYHYLEWCFLEDKPHQYDTERLVTALESSLTAACQAFTLVSGTACRMSIKVLGFDKALHAGSNSFSGFYVSTLARDNVSGATCREQDRSEGHDHRIDQNSDFRQILSGRIRYYFNHDLPNSRDYENSRMKGLSQSADAGNWSLPYSSTIVWPIRYSLTKAELEESECNVPLGEGGLRDQDIYGFLTVDSDARGAFRERYDVQMGAAIADSLFAVFSMLRQVRDQHRQRSKHDSH